jgi:hypothetical protein
MGRRPQKEHLAPDEKTLWALEEMRSEVLHELQDGAGTDMPDALLDEISELLGVLQASNPEKKDLMRLPVSA